MQITSTRTALGMDGWTLVEAAGTRIAVARRGQGVPLLCLHAVGHGAGDFALLAERLDGRLLEHGGIELVALDWPGHGNSPPDQTGAPMGAARCAEILLALTERLFPAEAPVLLGNSIGGAAAIVAAAQAPGRFAGLLLCNPGGLAPVDRVARGFCRAMAGFFGWGAGGAAAFPALFGAWYRLVLPLAPERRALIVAAGAETAGLLAEAWAGFAEPESDIRARLGQVTAPMLFAWARGDRIVSWGRSRAAVEASGAEVRMLRGGHSPFLEDPDGFDAVLLTALGRWGTGNAGRVAA
jgi:4,5:9,10-diseco-3-hydroxy-5,9,17-trioxoandrosta-1(10),2-diene-4-oate hydrolase